MKFSIVPIFVLINFAFCIWITHRAKRNQSISLAEAINVYALLLAFFAWTVVAFVMGIKGMHVALMERIPLLWQANVAIVLLVVGLVVSRPLRSGLRGIAAYTPWHWLVLFQALRIGAIGGVMKGFRGEVTSKFVFVVGIPDFLYGISALVLAWMMVRDAVGRRFLAIWNLLGAAIILLPLIVGMNHWMNEPGFEFMFEFPMILAPSIVVPISICLNLLLAWRIYEEGFESPAAAAS